MKKDPTSSWLLVQKARVLADTGDTVAAIAAATAGLKRYAGNTMLLATRCYARALGASQLDLAGKDCDEAIRNDAEDLNALTARALVGLRIRRWSQARADAETILKLIPNHPTALYMRGLARSGLGEAADEDLTRARGLDWDIDGQFAAFGLSPQPAAASVPAPSSTR